MVNGKWLCKQTDQTMNCVYCGGDRVDGLVRKMHQSHQSAIEI